MRDWNHYYYHVFPNELREFAALRVPEHHCAHCQAPQYRRCRIEENILIEKSATFRFAWYGITLLDQGLFTYFPEASRRWVKATGGYPLPVEHVGFGCVRVCRSLSTSVRQRQPRRLGKVCGVLDRRDGSSLEQMSGIAPHAFFEAATRDKAFDADSFSDSFEPHLVRAALARFAPDRKPG